MMQSLRRIISVARKELRQLLRDPLTLGFVVGVPVAQLLLFGYAINQEVRHVPTAVVDQSASSVSRRLLGQLEATQTFRITRHLASEEQALQLLTRGEVDVVAVVPVTFATDYYRGRGAEISLRVNATDPLLARAVGTSVKGLLEDVNGLLQPFVVEGRVLALRSSERREGAFLKPDLAHQQALHISVVNLYNPELRTAVFVVPALLGVILTTTMILMTAVSIVRERERGTFEFLIATPVRRLELMMGKISPYVAIGILQVVLVLLSGLLLFHVPVRGSLLDLGVSSMVFIAANLTLGLLISSISSSQLQATQISFFFFLPSVLLSGFMFPFESMPRPAQWLGELLPLTHYIRNVKAILLRDSSLLDQLPDLGAMLLFFVVGLVGATLLFRKRLG
jgi:ABC-2 type transport system permease protein